MLVKCLHNGNISQPHSHKNNNDIKAKVSTIDEVIQVQSADGNVLKYPWIWLRDNCQCSSCFNPKLQSRTIDWRTFDISVNPKSLHINNNILSIEWSDGHCSEFTLKWLHERSFTKDNQEKWLNDVYRLPKIPWSAADFPSVLKKFDYSDVIQSDKCLYEWLKALAEYGVAIVENTPIQEDQLRKLANRVSFIKRTHYGEEFEVRNKPDTTNVAYLSTPLQMHADLPYYEYKPGVNLLHCLVQTTGEGGDNLLTDCLHVSKILKEFHPEVYKILSTTLVEWSDIGEERGMKFFSLYRSPAICEDRWGQFARVNYSQQQRYSHFSIPLEDVIPWYKAHATFTQALYDPKNMVQFKTKPGDILSFDNIRLAHGRTGYTDTKSNERHLIGAYLDWDIVYSRIRTLKRQLNLI
ncbi:hypothetical protein R5R35_011064 [Gryllus longicercus]